MNGVRLAQASGITTENKEIENNTTANTEAPKGTNNSFTLGERDVSILIKNASTENPENTVFKVNDTYYRGMYLIQDFLAVGKDGVDVEFSNMKCNYKANVKIDPAIYIKNVIISYGYNSRGDCIHKVAPEEMQRLVAITTTPKIKTEYTIQLNDLSVLHIMAYAALGLFVSIYLGIIYITKKKVLIYNKNI